MERVANSPKDMKKSLIYDKSVLKLIGIEDKPEQTKLGDLNES